MGINVNDTDEGRHRLVKTAQLTYPQLLDQELKVSEAYQIRGLPTAVLVDRQGTIRFTGHTLPPDSLIESVLK